MGQAADALKATILADTNRDGKVDVQGNTDSEGKGEWTEGRGAIFLANIGDTDRRCSKHITKDTPDEELDACHDASDNVQRNPRYMAPLRTLPISGLGKGATGSVSVPKDVADKVRIFVKEGESWGYVQANHTFVAEELAAGLELGIDARDVRRPGGWDGRATVDFTVKDGGETASDSVALRVAPVLTHHHAQEAERFFVTSGAGKPPPQEQFVNDFKKNVENTGSGAPVHVFEYGDIWAQDFFEPAYTSMPGPNGGEPVVLRVLIRSFQAYRQAGREIFTLRDSGVGAVQGLVDGESTDSTGNLETIPPYKHNGAEYPAGRIIMGSQGGKRPLIFPFLEAQETQKPIEMDTDWLSVGHVDEFMQFLPVEGSERGWILMADDPLAGLGLLKEAVAAGHGNTKAISRPKMPYDPVGSDDPYYCVPTELTIDDVLGWDNFTSKNEEYGRHIEANLDILKRETGITDDEIIRVAGTFYDGTFSCGPLPGDSKKAGVKLSSISSAIPDIVKAATPPDMLKRRETEIPLSEGALALWAGIVNGVVLNATTVLAPNPWGPVIDGKDALKDEAEKAYAKAGYSVTWQDDWLSHHVFAGEVHCGSNSWRSTDAPWW